MVKKRCLVRTCRADCSNQKELKVALFRFPKDHEMRKKWFDVCGIPENSGPKNAFICSMHFDDTCIVPGRGGHLNLTTNAVPKVFSKENIVVASREPPPLVPLTSPAGDRSPMKSVPTNATPTTPARSRAFPILTKPIAIYKRQMYVPNSRVNVVQPPSLTPLRPTSITASSLPLPSPGSAPWKAPTFEYKCQPKVVHVNPIAALKLLHHTLTASSPDGRQNQPQESDQSKERVASLLFDDREGAEKKMRAAREMKELKSENRKLREEKVRVELKLREKLVKSRKKIKSLQQQIRNMRTRIHRLVTNKKVANKTGEDFIRVKASVTDDAVVALLRRMNGEFVGSYDDPHLRAFALSVHFYSPACYRMLRNKFKNALPAESTLRAWYSECVKGAGFTPESFNSLKVLATEKNRKLPVSLMVDDMAIRKKAVIRGDEVVGFPEFGSCSEDVTKLETKILRTRRENREKAGGPAGRTGKKRDDVNGEVDGGKKRAGERGKRKELGIGAPKLATDICVFMVVCLDLSVKIPVGYFVHNKLNGKQLAFLVKKCIKDLYEIGVEVRAVISDGASVNRTMARLLGADIDPVSYSRSPDGIGNLVTPKICKPFFKHPCSDEVNVYFMLDVCHMLKLVRNTLAGRKYLKDRDGKYISWYNITSLHSKQQKEGLRLGNRLTDRHMKWQNNKMKVTYAAQTLSRSVAQSLKFCEMIKEREFEDAGATANFLQTFNDLFDVLNSYSRYSYGLKSAMSIGNEHKWAPLFEKAQEYIFGLQIKDVKRKDYHSIFDSTKKVGFQGFMVAMESVKGLFNDLIRNGDLEYLCTYKLSQDHLESFFGKVRQRFGCDNNPSAEHFKGSYKRLLLGAEINISKSANILPQEHIQILNASKTNAAIRLSKKVRQKQIKDALINKKNCDKIDDFVSLGEIFSVYADPRLSKLSKFGLAAVTYISGYVCKSLAPTRKCLTCEQAMSTASSSSPNSGDYYRFIELKSVNNGLTVPSKDVVLVCTLTEEIFRRYSPNNKYPQLRRVLEQEQNIINEVVNEALTVGVFKDIFYPHNGEPPEIHLQKLIHQIASKYHKIRTKHLSKLYNDLNVKEAVRHKLGKLILFNNQ